ncbi:MaoC family dehydratase [Nesterenkonia sp.]|uniref:MaoC family dehydratase n=1 Tax=Nesterenkonia sp. TaxID=704201 RepID=UPI00261275FC|nr:MaoC family dehydratase [Nesterenkonia sp.]
MTDQHDDGTQRQPSRVVDQRGLYFDEIEVGTVYRHAPGRTITEADNVLFTTMTMNTQSLHLDAHWSAEQPFGQPLVNSMLTLATLVGASVAQISQGTIVANLGFESVKFPHPLYHGDTLYSESEILDKRLSSSRPGQGIVTIRHIGRNQEGTVVAECVRSVMLWLKDHHAAQMEAQR